MHTIQQFIYFTIVHIPLLLLRASVAAQMVKNLPAMQDTWVQSLHRKDLLEKGGLPIPVFLPGEFHGQRSLVSYRLWGRKESDTTERLTLSLSSRGHVY